jgi:porin
MVNMTCRCDQTVRLRATARASCLVLTFAVVALAANDALAQAPPATGGSPVVASAPHVAPLPAPEGTPEEATELGGYYGQYESFKQSLQNDYNIQYEFPVSTFTQLGVPHGQPAAVQLLYSPSVTWTPLNDTEIGTGSFNFAFTQYQYWTKVNTAFQQGRMGLLTPPNGQVTNGYEYVQATYTHTMPGDWKWLSVTVGQYEFDSFDNNQYADSAQTNFINYALAQNGTQAYANAGVGAYVQETFGDGQISFAEGFQSADNISGASITTVGLSKRKYNYFVYAQWVPAFLAGATYSIIWYSQPLIPQLPSAAQGVSFSAVQNFGDRWGLFLRANNASGAISPIETSIAWGAIYNDPFRHAKLDQVGLGLFWSKTNLSAVQLPARKSEWGVELYYAYTVVRGLQITPDVQLYMNPALAPTAGPAAMFTLRTTSFF